MTSFDDWMAQQGYGGGGQAQGERPFLTGEVGPQTNPMYTKPGAYTALGLPARPTTTDVPMQGTPSGLVDPNDPNSPTWAELPAHLMANDRKAYTGLMKAVKDSGYDSWEAVLDGASRTQVPIWDFLDSQVEANAAYLEAEGPPGGGPTSSVTTTTDLSSESESANTIDQIYQKELGRMATPKEIAAFQKALNKAQASSPTVSAYNNSGGLNQTATSKTTGGFDPMRFATEYAQSQPEYAETFAATTFMDILDRAISKPDAISSLVAGK